MAQGRCLFRPLGVSGSWAWGSWRGAGRPCNPADGSFRACSFPPPTPFPFPLSLSVPSLSEDLELQAEPVLLGWGGVGDVLLPPMFRRSQGKGRHNGASGRVQQQGPAVLSRPPCLCRLKRARDPWLGHPRTQCLRASLC